MAQFQTTHDRRVPAKSRNMPECPNQYGLVGGTPPRSACWHKLARGRAKRTRGRLSRLFRGPTHDRWASDPAFIDLSTRLRRDCPEFAAWWEQHHILSSGNGQKTLHHPEKGALRFTYATFQAETAEGMLRVLAARYSDRTGYKQTWRP